MGPCDLWQPHNYLSLHPLVPDCFRSTGSLPSLTCLWNTVYGATWPNGRISSLGLFELPLLLLMCDLYRI